MKASQHSFHTGQEFLGVERLQDVVVGAQLQTDDFVQRITSGSQHQNRHVRLPAQLTHDVKAAHAGQHQVKDDHIGVDCAHHRHDRVSCIAGGNFKTIFFEIKFQQLTDMFIVIDDQDFFRFLHVIPLFLPGSAEKILISASA